jgi:hypothetical protein
LWRNSRFGRRWLRKGSAEGREAGSGVKSRGKVADKGFHGRMPEAVEAEEIHLVHGLFGGPFLDGHAIDGGENTGAIVAEAAVHEDFFPRITAEKREELDDLFVGWWGPATDGNVHEAHAEGFGALALPGEFFAILAAQIDDGGDAQNFQFREAHFPGLRAAVKGLADFSGVVNSRDAKFFAMSKRREGGRGAGRGAWRWRLRKKRKRKKEKEGEGGARAFHFQLDAKSVA